jgi:hypothetical protein
MRLGRFVGIAATAAAAMLGPVAGATPAAAALPELGRCLSAPGSLGGFTDSRCTKASSTSQGHFEWLPGAADGFVGSSGKVRFQTNDSPPFRITINCHASSNEGRFEGTADLSLVLVFTGCERKEEVLGGCGELELGENCKQGREFACTTEGAAAGEIRTGPLLGVLGYIKSGSKPVVGARISGKGSTQLAAFRCGPYSEALSGAVIGAVKTADKMDGALSMKFTGRDGSQTPPAFEESATRRRRSKNRWRSKRSPDRAAGTARSESGGLARPGSGRRPQGRAAPGGRP